MSWLLFFFFECLMLSNKIQIWLERNIRNPKLITFKLNSCSCLLPDSLFKSILIQNFIYSEKICDYPIIHGCFKAQIHCFVTVVKKNHLFRSAFPMPLNVHLSAPPIKSVYEAAAQVLYVCFLLPVQWKWRLFNWMLMTYVHIGQFQMVMQTI